MSLPHAEPLGRALASVARIVSGIATAVDLPATLHAAMDAVREALAADAGVIRILQDPPGELVLAASGGLTETEGAHLQPRVPLSADGISARVARSKAPICLGRPEEEVPDPTARWRRGLISLVCVPMLVRDRLFGTLLVGARRPHAFGPEEVRLAETIAQLIAPALDRAALLDEVERLYAGALQAKTRADALAEVGRALASVRELDAVLDVIVDRTLAATGGEACGIYCWEAAQDLLRPVAVRGLSEAFRREFALTRTEGLSGLVQAGGQPVWTPDVLADPRIRLSPRMQALVAAEGFRSVLAVPIRLRTELFGTLLTYRWRPHAFTEEEVRFQAALADQAAVAIENARLFEGQREAARNADRQRARAEALAAVGQAVSASLDLDEILTLLVDRTAAATGADAAAVLERDPASGVVRFRRAHGLSKQFWQALALPPGAGIAGAALTAGRALWTPDIQADPRYPLPDHVQALNAGEGVRAILSVPVRGSEGPFGVLNLYWHGPHSFDKEEVAFATRIADQAALAIENARLYQEERNRSRDLAALIRAGRAVTSSLDLTQILETIVSSAAELTGASVAYLQLIDEGGRLVPRACGGPLQREFAEGVLLAPISVGESFSGTVAARGQPLWVADMAADPRELFRDFNARHGFRCYLGVPILAGDRALGVLSIIARPGGGVTDGRGAVLEPLAGQAAIAIENARLFAETREALEELAAIHEAGQAIAQTLDLEETLQHILAAAMRLTGMDKGIIWLLDEERQELAGTVVMGLPGELRVRIPLGEPSLVATCLRDGRALISESPDTDPRLNRAVQARFRNKALIAVPLRSGPRIIGILDLGDLKRPRHFTTREIAILERLAQQAVVAIEKARLYQQEQERRQQLEAARAVGEEITRELDLTALLGLIHRRAMDLVGAVSGALYLWDEAAQVLVPQAWHGHGEWVRQVRQAPGDGVAGTVAQRRKGMTVNDYRASPYAHSLFVERTQMTAVVAEPLLYRDRLVGVITLNHEGGGGRFTEQDRETLALFATQAAIAIENARLYAETRRAYEDLQAAQEQLVQVEKLRALGEMAGGVAHDFNNILAAILGRAQLLRIRGVDPHVRDGLMVIERAALDGAETVRRILGFARVRPEAQYAPVNVSALIPQVLEVTRPRWKDEAQARGAAIEVALALEPVPPVLGNAAELREVIVNLIFNAVDAMHQGGRLTVGARRLLRPGRRGGALNPRREALADEADVSQELVEVFIRDTGVGMHEAVRRRAFEPFFTTKGGKGSGLGLSVVYGIISRHGGEVLLESQEGAGTTVTLRLPATDKPVAERGTPALPPAARVGRIVVVDDEEVLGEALADLLRLQHHQVCAFTDPRLALEHLAREPADLLFTDLGMSEMSGWDLAQRARDQQPGLRVVLVTGWGHAIDPAQVRERRVNAVVAKPFRVEDILHVVADLLPASPAG